VLSQAAKPPKKGRSPGLIPPGKKTAQPAAIPKPSSLSQAIPVAPSASQAFRPLPPPTPQVQRIAAPQPPQQVIDELIVKRALEIISEESEIPTPDLKDDTILSEVGIDSLVSLMVASRFAEELDVMAESAMFMGEATVADIKSLVLESTSGEVPVDVKELETKSISMKATESPPAQSATSQHEVDAIDTFQRSRECLETPVTNGVDTINFDDVIKIMAEEIEVGADTITDQTLLTDLGVDSLLSLMIGSRLRDELDIEVDTASLLTSLSNVGALRQALSVGGDIDAGADVDGAGSCASTDGESPSVSSTVKSGSAISTPPSGSDVEPTSDPVPPTTSVVLQGSPRTATSTLWFFPDGSGLASSYLPLPRIRSDLVVYGINSPYLKKGTEMKCTWDELIGSYIREIQRRQPHGPYSFAGWSAGGIGAFHAAQVLMDAGHDVRDLIILDSPPPFHLAPLPERFFRYCAMAGLFGGRDGQTPEWVINHFRNINNVLSSYIPTPLKVSTLRKINILWACESSVDDRFEKRPDDPEDMEFLTTKRTDFTAGRWGPLFSNVPVQVDRAENEHHWSILVSFHPYYMLNHS
jgi:acyl carrier protein